MNATNTEGITEKQWARLPRPAKDRIERLEREVQLLRGRLSDLLEGASCEDDDARRVVLSNFLGYKAVKGQDMHLRTATRVKFRLSSPVPHRDPHVEAFIERDSKTGEDHVVVMGSHPLLVVPDVSNVVRVALRDS